jgi:hypothetical protein
MIKGTTILEQFHCSILTHYRFIKSSSFFCWQCLRNKQTHFQGIEFDNSNAKKGILDPLLLYGCPLVFSNILLDT